MDKPTQQALDAQEALSVPIRDALEEFGIEATLTALAEQFGITGATAIISGHMPASHFSGVYVLRALGVCNSLCAQDHIGGVL